MPIYEFHCAQCGQDSEVLVRSTQWAGTSCPHCGSKKLSKKLSVFAPAPGSPAPAPGSPAPAPGSPAPAPSCTGNPFTCGGCDAAGPYHH